MKIYVQYGCGLSAPKEWKNFDSSPTLRIQKLPVIGFLLKSKLNCVFPKNVLFGDIVRGLPVNNNSCDGIYCSHVLEHLSFNDFKIALANTYNILKPNGIFRLIVPDLEVIIKNYIEDLKLNPNDASIKFCGTNSLMGKVNRNNGIKGLFLEYFSNSQHLWMWDKYSLTAELKKIGFNNIRIAEFNDCEDEMFKQVENKDRFQSAVAIECRK
jgi:SAM-dependent methyltransferase